MLCLLRSNRECASLTPLLGTTLSTLSTVACASKTRFACTLQCTVCMQTLQPLSMHAQNQPAAQHSSLYCIGTEHYVDTVLAGFEDRLENLEKHCCSRDQSYHRLPFEPSSLSADVHSDGTDSSRDTFDWVEVEEVTHRVTICLMVTYPIVHVAPAGVQLR